MYRAKALATVVLVVAVGLAVSLETPAQQPPRGKFPTKRGQRDPREREDDRKKAPEPPRLPDDPKLLALHRDFVLKAEKLALDYQREQEYDKARTVCEEILKLVPRYPKAIQIIEQIDDREQNAETAYFSIEANKATSLANWQDTGVMVMAGKPVTISAEGSWTFKMSHELGPDGMEVPKALEEFRLGSLIGLVYTGDKENPPKPFYVGRELTFTAKETGRLYMKMHDSDPSDNIGKLRIVVRGTFKGDPKVMRPAAE